MNKINKKNIDVISEEELNRRGPEELRNGKDENEILKNRFKFELMEREKLNYK